MKVNGPHPLIRMHLARRGGHRSVKKIQVKDIDGHVQNLRSLITAEELKYKDKDKDTGKTKWVPKAGGCAQIEGTPQCQRVSTSNMATIELSPLNTVLDGADKAQTWRTTVLPADFDAFNFTPLEGDTCALVNLSDEWVQHPDECVATKQLPSEINDRQRHIDDWWETGAPQMHRSIIPYVKNNMFTSAPDGKESLTKTQLRAACMSGLRRLIQD